MKLSTILENLPVPTGDGYVEFDKIANLFGINTYIPDERDAWDARIHEHYVAPWLCTDTWVGMSVITLDDEPMMVGMQTGRKNNVDYEFVSSVAYTKMRDFIISITKPEDVAIPIADLDEEMGEGYHVTYGSQLLTDTVIYEGQKVKVVERYRGYDAIDNWGTIRVELADGTLKEVELADVTVPFVIAVGD